MVDGSLLTLHIDRVRRPALLLLACAVLLLGVAATASGDPPPATGPTYHYTVRAGPERGDLRVSLCFDEQPPPRLGPGVESAARALVSAVDGRGRALPILRRRIDLSRLRPGDCVRYRIDLDIARRSARWSGRFGDDILTSQGVWLWRDRRGAPRGGATLRFRLPEGVHAAVPWPRRSGAHQLGASAFRRAGFVSIGHRVPRVIDRQGVHARLVQLGDGWGLTGEQLEQWLVEAIDGISTVQGRFPVDDLLVMVVPAPGEGIGFGMVRRGGGHAVMFLIGRDSTVESLRSSWVTWHELSHLQLPALPQEDAWLYEGLATYYQAVLPVRLGIKTQQEAWADLVAGFGRGARSRARGRLSEASTSLMSSGSFSRVYWSGTVFALDADVTLRRRGSSLDAVLTRAGHRWRRDLRLHSGAEVSAVWDRPLARPVLSPLRARYANRRGFPPSRRLLERLGVEVRDGDVSLRRAEWSALRNAIMRRR